MAHGFFKHIPNINYDFKSDGKYHKAKDLFRKVSVWSYLQEGVTGYSYYRITEGERPDVVAAKLYGDSTLYWTFFLVNENLQDFGDWPKSQQYFNKFIDRKYSGKCLVASTSTDIVSYDHSKTEAKQLASRKFTLGEKVAEGTSETIASSVTAGTTLTLSNTNNSIKVGMRVTGGVNAGAPPITPVTQITGHVTVSAISGTTLTLSSDQTLVESSTTSALSFTSLENYGFITDIDPTHNRITLNDVAGSFTENIEVVGAESGKNFVISSIQNEEDAVHHYTNSDGFKTTVSTDNTTVTNIDHERALNEDKFIIRYIERKYMGSVVKEFQEIIRD